jgi:hypothetical protein
MHPINLHNHEGHELQVSVDVNLANNTDNVAESFL